jgi:hypothetical protein
MEGNGGPTWERVKRLSSVARLCSTIRPSASPIAATSTAGAGSTAATAAPLRRRVCQSRTANVPRRVYIRGVIPPIDAAVATVATVAATAPDAAIAAAAAVHAVAGNGWAR